MSADEPMIPGLEESDPAPPRALALPAEPDAVTRAVDAVAAGPEPEPIELPPYVPARRLWAGLVVDVVEQVYLPAPYSAIWLRLWVNVSDLEVEAAQRSKTPVAFLLHFVRGWNLQYEPAAEGGEPEDVPIGEDGLKLIPGLVQWIADEVMARRNAPLATKRAATSALEREPALLGGTNGPSRNGSG